MVEKEVEVVVSAEDKKEFNPADFTTATAKSNNGQEPKKDEPKVEPPVKEEPKPPIVSEEPTIDEFEVSFDDVIVDDASNAKPKKSLYDSIKEIDPDLEDEEKVVEKYKTLKEKNAKLEIIAKGRSLIDNDEDITQWTKMTKMSSDDKAKSALYLEYKSKGYDHDTAVARAEKSFNDLSELNPDAIQDKAMEYTSLLNRNIEAKTKHIEDSILANNIDLNVEDEVLKKVESYILETNEFLGMTLPKDEAKKAKVLKDAVEFAKSAEFKKELKDPKVLSEFAMYRKYKDNWKNNIKQRVVSKTAMVEKMATAPAVTPSRAVIKTDSDKPKGFNPDGFK